MKDMHRRGIRICIGGDYGFAWTPQGTNARDLQTFVEMLGFSPMEAILAATKYGGEIMGMGDELGQIKEGYLADVLLVDGDRIAMAEFDLDKGRAVGRVLRCDGALEDVRRRLDPGVLENLAFRGGVQKVGVDRERRFATLILGHRNLVLLGERDEIGPRLEVPDAPRRDDLDVRVEGKRGEFEADLIVALAGCAMRDRVGAGLVGDLDQPLGDQRAGDRGAEQIDAFVDGVHPDHRDDEIADEFLLELLDMDLLDTHHLGLLAGRFEFLTLAEIGGEGDDLGAVFGLKPFEDDRGIEPAGI